MEKGKKSKNGKKQSVKKNLLSVKRRGKNCGKGEGAKDLISVST